MTTRTVLALAAVLLGWLGLLAGVTLVSGAAPAVLVILPDADFLAALPEGVAITSRGALSVTLAGEGGDLARALCAAGARLVLPAGLLGCAPLTS